MIMIHIYRIHDRSAIVLGGGDMCVYTGHDEKTCNDARGLLKGKTTLFTNCKWVDGKCTDDVECCVMPPGNCIDSRDTKCLCKFAPTPGPHGTHHVGQGDYCGKISVEECGAGTPCTSFADCPAICNSATVCPGLQVGDDVKFDCSLKGTYCSS